MAANLTTQDQLLKTQFLELLRNQVNTQTDPVYNLMAKSTKNINANSVVKSTPFGINGGAGAGSETGALPTAGENFYQKLTSSTKNYYGQIQIGDKFMKSTKSNIGAFIDGLVSEMEGVKEATKFIFGRDLYLDNTGILASTTALSGVTSIVVDDARYLIEGMTIDLLDSAGSYAPIANGTARRIQSIDRGTKTVKLYGAATVTTTVNTRITTQNSYNLSLTGFKDIFKNSGTLYGVDRATNAWLVPSLDAAFGAISDTKIQGKIADLEDFKGSKVNYINISTDVEGFYMAYLEATRRNVNTMDVAGGYKAISFKDIPMRRSRFLASGTMDMLDTSKFTFHELSDWDWISGEGGAILQQVAGYPVYAASLAKYGELICDHPGGQARNTGVLTPA